MGNLCGAWTQTGWEWGLGEGRGISREGGRELFRIREGGWWKHNFSWGGQSSEKGAGWGSGRAVGELGH